jgi:DNA processing protein
VLPKDALVIQGLKGVGNRTLLELIKFFQSNRMSQLTELAASDLSTVSALKRAVKPLQELFSRGDFDDIRRGCEQSISEWSSAGISVVVYGSAEYPYQLCELKDPPALLFCKGNQKLLRNLKSIAVVGTRENTALGAKITRKTVEYFASEGFCIVSGLALGIDGIAHRAALASNALTIAVLVDVVTISPANHRELADQILLQGGLLVSENLPGTKVIPALFATRDRIQAGLARAVFAIETAPDGGTMHAVKTALALGREVYVPDARTAGYPDLGIKAISGTQALVHEGKAIAYTRENYPSIKQKLCQGLDSLEAIPNDTGLFS